MQYTVIINGQSYDLPKKTIKVYEEVERVSKVDDVKGMSLRDKFKTLFDFITSLVGKENAKEILGSDKLDEVDLSEVTLAFKQIVDAYDKPLEDYSLSKSYSKLDGIPVENIVKLVNAAEKAQQLN